MFKRWLRNKLRNILYTNENDCEVVRDVPRLIAGSCSPRPDYQHEGVLNIRVFGATGGTVIEISRYDRKTDMNKAGMYVIPDTDDFSNELSKIITMEQLKHF